jgi:ribosomal protein L40E
MTHTTHTNKPTLTLGRVDATKGPSILAALEQTSTRKPVLYADRAQASRRLPWHWPLIALGLAGAALWGYASWSSSVRAADGRSATPVQPQASSLPTTVPLTTSKTQSSGSVVLPKGAGADAVHPAPPRAQPPAEAGPPWDGPGSGPAARVDAIGVGRDAVGMPATLVDITPSVTGKSAPSSPVAAPNKVVATTAAPSTTVAQAAPKAVKSKARAAAVKPAPQARSVAAKPAEDDPDVAVVSALIGTARERGAEVTAPARQRPTIAGLIRQCNALKPHDAGACRRRICDGYWGKAQACPAAAVEHKTAQR